MANVITSQVNEDIYYEARKYLLDPDREEYPEFCENPETNEEIDNSIFAYSQNKTAYKPYIFQNDVTASKICLFVFGAGLLGLGVLGVVSMTLPQLAGIVFTVKYASMGICGLITTIFLIGNVSSLNSNRTSIASLESKIHVDTLVVRDTTQPIEIRNQAITSINLNKILLEIEHAEYFETKVYLVVSSIFISFYFFSIISMFLPAIASVGSIILFGTCSLEGISIMLVSILKMLGYKKNPVSIKYDKILLSQVKDANEVKNSLFDHYLDAVRRFNSLGCTEDYLALFNSINSLVSSLTPGYKDLHKDMAKFNKSISKSLGFFNKLIEQFNNIIPNPISSNSKSLRDSLKAEIDALDVLIKEMSQKFENLEELTKESFVDKDSKVDFEPIYNIFIEINEMYHNLNRLMTSFRKSWAIFSTLRKSLLSDLNISEDQQPTQKKRVNRGDRFALLEYTA